MQLSATIGVHSSTEVILNIIFSLVLAASLSTALQAQNASPGRLSGAQMIERWTSPAVDGTVRSHTAIFARQYADGYLAGVADASEGALWCNRYAVKPHEVDAEIMGVLKSMAASKASRTVAARLVTEALASRFPCKESAQ